MELQHVGADGSDQGRNISGSNGRAVDSDAAVLTRDRSYIVIIVLSLVMFVNSVSTGILTVGIPRMATDLELSEDLILW